MVTLIPHSSDTVELINTIKRGIQSYGLFLLMDDRIDLICGESFNGWDLSHVAAVNSFATENQWTAVVAGRTVTFTREPMVDL